MRVCACVEYRGGTIVRVNKVVGGLGAGTGIHVQVAVGSSWDRMEFGMVNAMVLLFPFHNYSLWITAVHSTAHLWMMKVGKGQL